MDDKGLGLKGGICVRYALQRGTVPYSTQPTRHLSSKKHKIFAPNVCSPVGAKAVIPT